MGVTHHIRVTKFSLKYHVATRIGVLAARQLGTTVVQHYCFNLVQQKWVTTSLLVTWN